MSVVRDSARVAGVSLALLVYIVFALACLALPVAACWYLFTH